MNKKKIFCIGMTKTGTTSLMKALRILGYKVANVYTKANYKKFDAIVGDQLCTIPINFLKTKHPNDLFILTYRTSVEIWWDSIYNFARQENKVNDETVKRIRKLIYGYDMPEDFNKNDFINIYISRFNQGMNLFNGTDNFLNICFENGEGWTELCRFLKKDIPNIDFPHSNKRK